MMNRIVPHEINYRTINKIGSVATFLLYASALVAITVLVMDKIDFINSKVLYNRNLNACLAILSIMYYMLDIIQNYLFQQAELNRKNDFIDNSFETNLSDENSQGYFSNDTFTPGVKKLGINGFENSFFTKSISNKMIAPSIFKSAAILILFLFVIFFTDQTTLVAIFQIALPFTIIQQTIRLIIFHKHIKSVFETYRQIFTTVAKNKRGPLIISNVINYEKSLSWGGIQLDSKLFKKYNPKLTADWEVLKTKYQI